MCLSAEGVSAQAGNVERGISKRGISLVEVVIGTALILASLTGLTAAYSFYLKAGLRTIPELQGTFLLEEGMEAAALIRDDGWTGFGALTADTPYFLEWSGGKWRTTATPSLVDGVFRRTLTFSPVYRRNSDKDIVASTSPDGKTLDLNTREVTVRVFGAGAELTAVTYLTNLFE